MTEAGLKRFLIAFRIFILVPALLIFGSGVYGAWMGHRSSSWPVVAGTIDSIEETSGSGRLSGSSLRVRYSYEYSGSFYEGDRIRIGWNGGKDREFVMKLPRDNVPIRVNPERPEQAALLSGVGSGDLVAAGFGLFMAVGVVVVTWVAGNPNFGKVQDGANG